MPHVSNDKIGVAPHKDEKARILSLFPSQLIGDLENNNSTTSLVKLIEDYYDSLYQVGQVAQVEVVTSAETFTKANQDGVDLNIAATGGNGNDLTLNLSIYYEPGVSQGKIVSATIENPGYNYFLDDIVKITIGTSVATLRVIGLNSGPSDIIQGLSNSRDIDNTSDRFLNQIQQEIAKSVPKENKLSKRQLFKRIVSYYKMKGSEESIQTFFDIFFGTGVQVAYPNDITIKPSTGTVTEIRNEQIVDLNLEHTSEFGTRRYDYVIPFQSITSSPNLTTPFRTRGSSSPLLLTPSSTVITRNKQTNGAYADQSPDNVLPNVVKLSGFELHPSEVEFNTQLSFTLGDGSASYVTHGGQPTYAAEWGLFEPLGVRDGKQRYFNVRRVLGRVIKNSPNTSIFSYNASNDKYLELFGIADLGRDKIQGYEISFNSPDNRWEYRYVTLDSKDLTGTEYIRNIGDIGNSPGHQVPFSNYSSTDVLDFVTNPNAYTNIPAGYPTYKNEHQRWDGSSGTYLGPVNDGTGGVGGLLYDQAGYYGFTNDQGIQIIQQPVNGTFTYDSTRLNDSTGTFINSTNQYLKILKIIEPNTAGTRTGKWAIVNCRKDYDQIENVTVSGGAKATIQTTNNAGVTTNFDFNFDGNYYKYSEYMNESIHIENGRYQLVNDTTRAGARSGPEFWHSSPTTKLITKTDVPSFVRQTGYGTEVADYTLTVSGTALGNSPLHGVFDYRISSSIYSADQEGAGNFGDGRPDGAYHEWGHRDCPSIMINLQGGTGYIDRSEIRGPVRQGSGSPLHPTHIGYNDFYDWYNSSPTAMEIALIRQNVTISNASPAIVGVNQSYSPADQGRYYQGLSDSSFYISKSTGNWKIKREYTPSQITVLAGNVSGEPTGSGIDGTYSLENSPFNGKPVWKDSQNQRIYFSSARNRWELTDSPSIALATKPVLFSDPPGDSPSISGYAHLPPRTARRSDYNINLETGNEAFKAPYQCFRTDSTDSIAAGQFARVDLFWQSPTTANYSPDANIHSTGQTYGQRTYPEPQSPYNGSVHSSGSSSPAITRSGEFLHATVSFNTTVSQHVRLTPYIINPVVLSKTITRDNAGGYDTIPSQFGNDFNNIPEDSKDAYRHHVGYLAETISSPNAPYHLPYYDLYGNQFTRINKLGQMEGLQTVLAYGEGNALAFRSSTAGDYIPKTGYLDWGNTSLLGGVIGAVGDHDALYVTHSGASSFTVAYNDIVNDQSPVKIYFKDPSSPSSTKLFNQIDGVNFSPVNNSGLTTGTLLYSNQSSPILVGNSSNNTIIDSPIYDPPEQIFTTFDYSPHQNLVVAQDSPGVNHSPSILRYVISNAGVMNGTYDYDYLSSNDTPVYKNINSPVKQIIINTKGLTLGSTGASNTPTAHLNINGLGTRLRDTSASPNAGTLGKNSPFDSPTGLGNYFDSPSTVGAALQFGGGIQTKIELRGIKSNVGTYPARSSTIVNKPVNLTSSPSRQGYGNLVKDLKEEVANKLLNTGAHFSSDVLLSQYDLSKDDNYPHTSHLIHKSAASGKLFGSATTLGKKQHFFVIAREPAVISYHDNCPRTRTVAHLTNTLNTGDQLVLSSAKAKNGSPGDPSIGFISSTGLVTVSTASFDCPTEDTPVGKSLLQPLHNASHTTGFGTSVLVDENLNFYSPNSLNVCKYPLKDGITGSPSSGRYYGLSIDDNTPTLNSPAYIAIDANDGAGNDIVCGTTKRNMKDTYVYANSISSYTIISPYDNNVQVTYKLFNESSPAAEGEYVFANHSLTRKFQVKNSSPDRGFYDLGRTSKLSAASNLSPNGADGIYNVTNAGTLQETWTGDGYRIHIISSDVAGDTYFDEYGDEQVRKKYYWAVDGIHGLHGDYQAFTVLPGTPDFSVVSDGTGVNSSCPQAVSDFRDLLPPFRSHWGSPNDRLNMFAGANFMEIPDAVHSYGNISSSSPFSQSPQKISINSPNGTTMTNVTPKLWKFKGRRPFQLIINNLAEAETQVGFNSNAYSVSVDSSETQVSGRGVNYFDTADNKVKVVEYNPSIINNINKIHDSSYYQTFSYEIYSTLPVENWKTQYEELVHPGGMKYWSKVVE